jgi:hypothetical protein
MDWISLAQDRGHWRALAGVSSVLRHVTADGNVEERFLHFTDMSTDRSANSLFNHAVEILNDLNVVPNL